MLIRLNWYCLGRAAGTEVEIDDETASAMIARGAATAVETKVVKKHETKAAEAQEQDDADWDCEQISGG